METVKTLIPNSPPPYPPCLSSTSVIMPPHPYIKLHSHQLNHLSIACFLHHARPQNPSQAFIKVPNSPLHVYEESCKPDHHSHTHFPSTFSSLMLTTHGTPMHILTPTEPFQPTSLSKSIHTHFLYPVVATLTLSPYLSMKSLNP